MIEACAECGSWRKALRMFQSLVQDPQKLEPNGSTYKALTKVRICCCQSLVRVLHGLRWSLLQAKALSDGHNEHATWPCTGCSTCSSQRCPSHLRRNEAVWCPRVHIVQCGKSHISSEAWGQSLPPTVVNQCALPRICYHYNVS